MRRGKPRPFKEIIKSNDETPSGPLVQVSLPAQLFGMEKLSYVVRRRTKQDKLAVKL